MSLRKLFTRNIIICCLFVLATVAPSFIQSTQAQTPDRNLELVRQASEYYRSQQYDEAAVSWQKVAENYALQGDKLNEAMAQGNLSLSYQNLGEWQKAQSASEQSFAIVSSQKSSVEQQKILAQSLSVRGKLALELGKPKVAIESWSKANKLYDADRERAKIIKNQINQATALEQLGFYPRACDTLLESLAIDISVCSSANIEENVFQAEITTFQQRLNKELPKIKAIRLEAAISLGNNLRILGKLSESNSLLDAILSSIPEGTKEYYRTVLALGNTNRILAQRYRELDRRTPNESNEEYKRLIGEYSQKAFKYYQAAIEQKEFKSLQLQARLNWLSWNEQNLEWRKNLSYLAKTTDLLNELPFSNERINSKIKLGQSLFCLERENPNCLRQSETDIQQIASNKSNSNSLNTTETEYQKQAIKLLTTALNEAQSIENQRSESYAFGSLGRMQERLGNLPTALDNTERALELARQIKGFDLAYQWQWQLGRLLLQENKQSRALKAYGNAIDSLQQIRSDLVALNRDLQFSFREEVEPVYRKTVSLILESADRALARGDLTTNQQQLGQARDIIESLQLAELDNFFQEACIDAKPQSIEQIDPKSAVIYSIILEDRLEIILSVPDRPLVRATTEVSQTKLEETVAEIRDVLVFPNTSTEDYLPLFQKLYSWLVSPVAKNIQSETSTLTFILDGVLRNIPMSVLHDGEKYLIEDYAIALTPGLQLLQPKSLTQEKLSTLAAGISQSRQVRVGEREIAFSPLPNVTIELDRLAKLVPTQVLEDRSFLENSFRNKLQSSDFNIVHIASHGQFSSIAENTFIVSWNDAIDANELQNFLQDRDEPNRPIEMLVLSACETATGDKQAALGLAGVAIRAGARSTVASLWQVSDLATVELIGQLYQQLVDNPINKAEALRMAQLDLLQQEQFSHPYFWSAFVLVGNWL